MNFNLKLLVKVFPIKCSGSGSGSILHKLHDWDVNMQAQSTEQYA